MTDQLTDKARRADQKHKPIGHFCDRFCRGRIRLRFSPGQVRGKKFDAAGMRMLRPRARWMDLQAIELPDTPLVDCFEGTELDRTLALLSQVGLAEAWSYLRTPAELSEGQRWRLKLALAIAGRIRLTSKIASMSRIPPACGLQPAWKGALISQTHAG